MTIQVEQFVNKFIHHDGIYPRNKLLNYKHKSLQISMSDVQTYLILDTVIQWPWTYSDTSSLSNSF